MDLIFATFILAALSSQPAGSDTVESYRQVVNAHDLEGALSLLAPDFQLRFAGSEHVLSKQQLAVALSWDAGANGRVVWKEVEREGAWVVFEGHESNDFLQLLGIERLEFRTSFKVDAEGRISEQIYQPKPDQPSVDKALKPAVEWASRHRSEELQEIYPQGQLIYSEAMARRWIALLKEWKASSASKHPR